MGFSCAVSDIHCFEMFCLFIPVFCTFLCLRRGIIKTFLGLVASR